MKIHEWFRSIIRQWLFILLWVACLTQSGCDLLSIPVQILGSMFGLASSAVSTAVGAGIAAAPYAAPFFL